MATLDGVPVQAVKGKFSYGGAAIWENFAFADIFADPFLRPEMRRAEMPGPAFVCLASSIKMLSEATKRIRQESIIQGKPSAAHFARIDQALRSALEIGQRLPIGLDPNLLDQKFMEFLDFFVGKVNYLRSSEFLLFPGGWRTSESEGHALMYVLYKKSADKFSFTVSNCGSGSEGDHDATQAGLAYHAAKAECAPPKIKRALSLVIEDIPLPRLKDTSFWFALFRPLVYPNKNNDASYLYAVST